MVQLCDFYVCCIIFFFKQKTAYEMLRSLVGSEMCIRDSNYRFCTIDPNVGLVDVPDPRLNKLAELVVPDRIAVSYTHLTLPTIYSV